MFWRKKNTNKVERSQRPPVEELSGFVEWLLRYGKDFDVFRQTLRGTVNNFVSTYTKRIAKDLDDCSDEASLTARIVQGCGEYAQFAALVDTAGGIQNLPSHIYDKAFPMLVELRLLMYVRNQKYRAELTPEMQAVGGPLLKI